MKKYVLMVFCFCASHLLANELTCEEEESSMFRATNDESHVLLCVHDFGDGWYTSLIQMRLLVQNVSGGDVLVYPIQSVLSWSFGRLFETRYDLGASEPFKKFDTIAEGPSGPVNLSLGAQFKDVNASAQRFIDNLKGDNEDVEGIEPDHLLLKLGQQTWALSLSKVEDEGKTINRRGEASAMSAVVSLAILNSLTEANSQLKELIEAKNAVQDKT